MSFDDFIESADYAVIDDARDAPRHLANVFVGEVSVAFLRRIAVGAAISRATRIIFSCPPPLFPPKGRLPREQIWEIIQAYSCQH